MKNKYSEKMKALGWEWIGTGGGCDSYIFQHPTEENTCILLTRLNDCNIPEKPSDEVGIGIYTDPEAGWAGEGIFEMSCKFSDVLNGKIKFHQWGKGGRE